MHVVKYGVPQGNVLSPLLFTININDLPKAIPKPMSLFADDSAVIINNTKYNPYENVVNNTLKIVIDWMTNNNLKNIK